jgi:hypothetical protein
MSSTSRCQSGSRNSIITTGPERQMHPCTRYVYGQRALSRVWQLSYYYHDQRRDRGDCAHLLNNASSPNVFSILFLLLLKNGSLQNPLLQNCRRLSLHFSPRIISLCGKCSGTITFCHKFIPKELHWADCLANPTNRKPSDPCNLAYGMPVTFIYT